MPGNPNRNDSTTNTLARAYFDPYSIRGLKMHETRDGYAFVCDLLKDGNPIAAVEQDGRGGMTRFIWLAEVNRSMFEAFAATKPQVECEGSEPMPVDAELLIEQMVEREDTLRRLRGKMRSHILFQTSAGIGGEKFRVIKAEPTKAAFDLIRQKFVGQPVFILNEESP